MAENLQVEQDLNVISQPITDQNGNASPLTLSTNAVGIGTTQPGEKLDVSGGAVRITNGGNGAVLLELNSDRNWQFRQLGTGAGAALELASIGGGGNKHFVINTSGNVGIGTTQPGEKLDVSGGAVRITNGGNGAVLLELNSDRNWQFRQLGTGAGAALELASIGGGGNKHFVINTSGNVGIGTTQPGSTLHVAVGTAQEEPASPRISGTYPSLSLYEDTERPEGRNWAIAAPWFADGDFVIFQSNVKSGDPRNAGTARLYINPGGNVGIGTTQPGSTLHVAVGTAQEEPASPRISGTYPSLSLYEDTERPEGRNWAIAAPWFADGDFVIFQSNVKSGDPRNAGTARLYINPGGNVGIGTTQPTEKLEVQGNILATGDIILVGADCAEDFDVETYQALDPGTVMVIGDEDTLYQCAEPYDKRVAGVLSGAGDYRPGIILGKEQSHNKRMPLALTGKVYCKVDAQYAPIGVGDLLTTSPTPGHAMKADNPLKAFGAVIGKALRPLTAGQGLIPILIALQ